MRLKNLTRGYIENFANSVIFGRGQEYFKNGNVTDLEYDEDTDSITADVEGNYDNYSVEVNAEDGDIEANCDCLYDGYPCKHIVAVMLEFVENQSKYTKKMTNSKAQDSTLKDKIAKIPKDELLEIIMDCAKKYPEFKSELMVRFIEDKQIVINTIHKQIGKAFSDIEGDDETQGIKKLKTIAKQVDAGSDEMKIDVYWDIADGALEELNEYGRSDDILEDVAIDNMRKLAPVLKGKPELKQKKHKIIEELMKYYEWGNCGIADFIYETVDELLEDKSDYQIVIDCLEKEVKSSTDISYNQILLASLYEEIGDDESSLKILQSNLHYGMDYWRLAEYWIARDNDDKALEIVKDGLEKGEGRREELYVYMKEHYEKRKDYDALLALLKSKIKDNKTGFDSIGNDEIYKDLMSYYESKSNYDGIFNLLKMRLEYETRLNFEFYKEAKGKLKEQDWLDYEKKFITKVKNNRFINKNDLLAEIYDYQGNTDELWKVVKENSELLKKYEDKLFSKYSTEYLEQYKGIVAKYIGYRGRENYVFAAQLAGRIKHLYCEVLKNPNNWESYIQNLRIVNKQLRAMQEEFRHL